MGSADMLRDNPVVTCSFCETKTRLYGPDGRTPAVRMPGYSSDPEGWCEFCGDGPACIVCGRGRNPDEAAELALSK